MADSVQVEEPQRRAVGGTITTGRIHKGKAFERRQFSNHLVNGNKNNFAP